MRKTGIEAPSTACLGCEYIHGWGCKSPTLCIHRRIEGTYYTVADVMEDLKENKDEN